MQELIIINKLNRNEVNQQNCKYLSAVHRMCETHSQYAEQVNVWAGIIGEHIFDIMCKFTDKLVSQPETSESTECKCLNTPCFDGTNL